MSVIKTDLVDRYLYAVKFWLPKAQQEDIIAELGEDLLSQLEERQAALGRELDEDDVAAILKRRGDPMKVASSYLPGQRLINPAVLPVYWLVLKIVLLWVLAPLFALVFLGPVTAGARPWQALLVCSVEYWRAAFMTVGMVTAFFVLLDRYQVRFQRAGKWEPRELPRVPGTEDTKARWNDLTGFIIGLAAAGFWVYLARDGNQFSLPGVPRFSLRPVWRQIYWPVLGLVVANTTANLLSFLRSGSLRVHSGVRIGVGVCGLAIAAVLLKAGNPVEITGGGLPTGDLAGKLAWLNAMIDWTISVAAVITISHAVVETRRLLRGAHTKTAPIPSAMQH
jgi:hypothetical protein